MDKFTIEHFERELRNATNKYNRKCYQVRSLEGKYYKEWTDRIDSLRNWYDKKLDKYYKREQKSLYIIFWSVFFNVLALWSIGYIYRAEIWSFITNLI